MFWFVLYNCYYIVRDEDNYEFVLDEEKVAEVNQKTSDSNEIEDLQKKLNETDYIFAKYCEELLSLNNPLTWVTDVIKLNVKYMQLYAETIKNRKQWRERIEELGG